MGERVTRLATEKVAKFCEKVAEGERGAMLCGRWGGTFRDCWVKPVGSADGDQSEANATTVPHRTENILFSTVKVFVSVINGCVV